MMWTKLMCRWGRHAWAKRKDKRVCLHCLKAQFYRLGRYVSYPPYYLPSEWADVSLDARDEQKQKEALALMQKRIDALPAIEKEWIQTEVGNQDLYTGTISINVNAATRGRT